MIGSPATFGPACAAEFLTLIKGCDSGLAQAEIIACQPIIFV